MKEELRSSIIKKRRGMSQSEVMEKSAVIKDRLFHMNEFSDAKTILFYVSYNNEVFTHAMMQECLESRKTVVVPKCDTNRKKLILSKLSQWEDLSRCSYSILEPRDDRVDKVAASSIDLCIIPGIVFDLKGNRIGHGTGYYDRLLQKNKNRHVIGLAFELQIVERIPAEKHDVRVEKIVTEKRIISCST